MSRSGAGGGPPTVVLTVAEVLFSSSLSAIALSGSTTAVFVSVPPDGGAVPVIVMVAFWPSLTAPPVQVTVEPVTEQPNRLEPFALMPVMPAGTVSTTLTPVAFAAPLLFTVSVYVIAAFGATLVGPVLLIVRSGRPPPEPLMTRVERAFESVVKF